MIDLKQVLYDIVKSIVSTPDEVTIVEESSGDDNNVNLVLSVAPDDMGMVMVIGKHGKVAKAIRTVMKAAANSCDKKVNVEIR